jgi:hypothetical protein
MRATELMSCTVVDETGTPVGQVHDIRITRRDGSADGGGRFRVAGLAVGGGRVAHAWGFAEQRATGPWLLRMITARGSRTARFVPADRVTDWGPHLIRIRGRGDDLPYLHQVVS